MYRCQICGCVAPARTPARRVVIETRPKTYPTRLKPGRPSGRGGGGGRGGGRGGGSADARGRNERVADRGGEGNEIVKELVACPTCARERGTT